MARVCDKCGQGFADGALHICPVIIKDSGHRREFKTGAVRDMHEGKGRYDLIPYNSLRRLAIIFEKGALKYGEHNWQKGIEISSYLDSAMRHLQKVAAGLTDEDHAAMAMWNICTLMWTLEQIDEGKLSADLDNRAYKQRQEPTHFEQVPGTCCKIRAI